MSHSIMIQKQPTAPDASVDKKKIEKETKWYCKHIATMQEKLYAQKKYGLLIVLQGMDAAGKSSTIRDVFKYVNPMGIITKSFKKPSEEELAHDFLWRAHPYTPGKGMISIFDRSYYEEVLIQRVHQWVDEDQIKTRYQLINGFEQLLSREANTRILKFYLNISFKKQGEELKQRIDDPEKRWKHNDQDWKEREYWDQYMAAYNDVFNQCGPQHPWTIVPADKSWYKRYVVAKTLYNHLKALDLEWPEVEG